MQIPLQVQMQSFTLTCMCVDGIGMRSPSFGPLTSFVAVGRETLRGR